MEPVWPCQQYYGMTHFAAAHHGMQTAKPEDPIYQELRVDPTKITLYVCANCGGVRRLHKHFFKFIDRRTP